MGEEEKKVAEGAETVEEEGSIVDQILTETVKIQPKEEGYDITKKGVAAFISELLAPNRAGAKVHPSIVNEMIAEIDNKLSKQIDQILHNEKFQTMEASWKGLKYVIDNTDFRENIKVEMINVSKEDLLDDFEDAPEITKSGLYKTIYGEYGTFGGSPVGVMVGNYDFGPGSQDISLLRNISSVSAMSHAPFIAAAGTSFFGKDKDFQNLANLNDIASVFEGPKYTKWNSFRETEDSRYIGLTMPRFLLREPYGENNVPVKSFNYNETADEHDQFLWGNASFAFITRIAESFAKYRWCPNIIGPSSGGAVENLPVYNFDSMGTIETKIPTEVLLTERREFELAEAGLIGLAMRKGSDNACFFSANSTQKPKTFGNTKEGKEFEANYRLGTQLPYVFVVSRLAHYLKVIQRESLGSYKDRGDLERELNKWIMQYVSAQDVVSAGVKARKPLREASVTVEEVPGEVGWYKVDMKVRPHFKYMGSFFTLSLVSKMDKA